MSSVGDILFASGIAFLLGFKIAAWMGKRQAERLRSIRIHPDSPEGGAADGT